MADPLVSVVLPTYNRLAMLREAVDSVLAQTERDWELIVLDDGSDDGSADYLAALAATEPRLVVVSAPHGGRLPALRNQGIARARGRWVAFHDSDDVWRQDKLERHLRLHAEHPGVRWSYSGRAMMDAGGAPLADAGFARWHPHAGSIAPLLLTHQAMVAMPALVAERALLLEVGGLDESLRYCGDFDLQLRLAAAAPCAVLAEPLVSVRIHSGNWTRDRVEVNESFIRVFAKFARAHPEHRRLCRRQQAHHAVWVCRKRVAAGDRPGGLRALLYALRCDPRSPALWGLLRRWLGYRWRRAVAPPAPGPYGVP